jgi:hypothetical protein
MRPRPDFVKVRLTAAACELAAGGPVTVCAGDRHQWIFRAGDEQEVTKWDWQILKSERSNGTDLFEIVDTAQAS